jgi:4-aminobutyrate aminotransferase-like enzyme
MNKQATLEARKRLLGRNLSVAYDDPVKIVRGEMQYLYDDEGRRYLDAYNNVAHVGHCHPRVVAAAQEQMRLLNTNTRYLHDLIVRYAERLTATLPEPLSVCYFVNSGSEANELAVRLARAHTKGRDMIVLEHAYHGNTTTLIDLSPYKHEGPGGSGPPAWVHKVPWTDAQQVVEVVDKVRQEGRDLCGFLAESMPSVAGQIVLPKDVLGRAFEAVRGAGGVCIADEVQTGYGRIGTHFWAFEHYNDADTPRYNVVPDIVVLGKPIGNGHPIGAVVTTPEIASSFANGMEFFSTFGGNTFSCAIGLEVLAVVQEEKLQAHALDVGNHLLEGLRALQQQHDELIREVRGSGLFLGVELASNNQPATRAAENIVNRMREAGVLLGADGPHHNVLKIRPPMPFSHDDADYLLRLLRGAIEQERE